MGKKYIIDLNPDCVEGEYLRIPARIAGEQQWLMTKAALTPYTEPDLEHVRKEAYEQGYYIGYSKRIDKSYEDGLSDAWEAARKIANLVSGEQKRLFGGFGIYFIAHEFSAPEAIEKIRQYEQEKEMDGLRQNIQTIVDKCGYSLDEIAAVLEKMRGEQE